MSARTSTKRSLRRRGLALGLLAGVLAGAGVGFGACSPTGTSRPTIVDFQGGPAPAVDPLTATEVDLIVQRAFAALPNADIHVAVTARTGDILAAYSSDNTVITDADNIAVSLARTTSFFSNSQAPLSSRTVETLGTYHFPPTFGSTFFPSQVPAGPGVIAPNRIVTGVTGTPQGPLWQLNSTNRGAVIDQLNPFNIGNVQPGPAGEPRVDPDPANLFFNPSVDLNGGISPGITLLPGAVPLFKPNGNGVLRLVGGIGVYVLDGGGTQAPNVEAAEYAAIEGASGRQLGGTSFFFDAIPLEGAITIVGVLLPYVKQTTPPTLANPIVQPSPGYLRVPMPGRADPFGYLIGPDPSVDPAPIDDATGGLTSANVQQIIAQVVASANLTRGQVRLPLGSSARVIATVVDTNGLILAHYRMEDTLCDAIDVVPAKARSCVYFCLPPANPRSAFANGDVWPDFPADPTGLGRGVALTTRTLGFLSQPFYPPGIGTTANPNAPIAAPDPGNTAPGPLYNLALLNQLPTQAQRLGNSPPDAARQNGLTFFPGTVPLYKPDASGVPQLVGALGVSGDGVEQNDLIAFDGGRGFEPPPELRIDNFTYLGVRLPYLKFPQTPR